MSWSSNRVRQTFVDFFRDHGHTVVASSGLVPADDPTLLFTNAGMNQFKEVFLGEGDRSYRRAVTVQKCMRVSGKHNDLETVGPSIYHHTFFEMLGNFSFGDYFKKEAVRLAWDLLTDGYGIDGKRLWASVYRDDDDAHELWKTDIGLPQDRIVRLGKKDNFWSMGDTGPCGPCSEIHFDTGDVGCTHESCGPGCDCGRFLELWNLVFMQFNCAASGEMAPLPAPNIDTGAGLERLTAVLEGVKSNYDTDLFQPIIRAISDDAGVSYGDDDETDVALRVIADHTRAVAFLLADGIMPANEGRGYVLRRLLRRAMRFGMKLGYEAPFLYEATDVVVEGMGEAYPELGERQELIGRVVRSEEDRFLQTLAAGTRVFNQVAAAVHATGGDTVPGDEAFRLYDTFGLPLELTRDFASAEGMTVDEGAFHASMEAQRTRARAARDSGRSDFSAEEVRAAMSAAGVRECDFVGYDTLEEDGATVVAVLRDGAVVDVLDAGQSGALVVDRTPFYAESGGQVGDRGEVTGDELRATVLDTRRPATGVIVHEVEVSVGALRAGDRVGMAVDPVRRIDAQRNHTATHLLHAALRERLGPHVKQAGSLVDPERLRFDFSHYDALGPEDLSELEMVVNEAIRGNSPVTTEDKDFDAARAGGALAFFGEKYGDRVRVVEVPGISMELCGGTHVMNTGEIGTFVIQHEESVAAGTRRIEAVTGRGAVEAMQHARDLVRSAAGALRTPSDQLPMQVERLMERVHSAERDVEELKMRLASRSATESLEAATAEVAGVNVIARQVDALDPGGMRTLVDEMKGRVGSGVVVVGTVRDDKAAIVVGVTSDVAPRLSASDIVARLSEIVGGGGGGHREMAQAGGPHGDRVGDALARVPELVADLLD